MPTSRRIPTPFWLRLRRWRTSVGPLLTFLVTMTGTFYLWSRQAVIPPAMGEALSVRLDVVAAAEGQLTNFRGPWKLFDTVTANQVIARIDDRPVLAKLETLQKQLAMLRSKLRAEQAAWLIAENDRHDRRELELQRLQWEVDASRLEAIYQKVELEGAKIELQRRTERLSMLEPLVPTGAVTRLQYSEEKLLHDRLAAQLKERQVAQEQAQIAQTRATERLQNLSKLDAADMAAALEPLHAEIAVQESLMAELQFLVAGLEIRAPMSGVIAVIHRWPGQHVRMGDPLITIANAHSEAVISYLRPENQDLPAAGDTVSLRPRRPGTSAIPAIVEHVGPQVELVPEHQRRDPKLMEWGLPVRIALPADARVIPGELLDVLF
ncbi:MAG: HlyD family efflux transporter periplasmic adaptor subunit [Pirellulales bacterium]|nr:HlyD family efflux transporter periplasmic adaptor subunit [Pirellulales bacterium]